MLTYEQIVQRREEAIAKLVSSWRQAGERNKQPDLLLNPHIAGLLNELDAMQSLWHEALRHKVSDH